METPQTSRFAAFLAAIATIVVAGCSQNTPPMAPKPGAIGDVQRAVRSQWEHEDKAQDAISGPDGVIPRLERAEKNLK